jgi:hypothetical protein
MAQQATAISKKKEVTPPAFASITAADIIRAPVVEREVPLDLRPLLKPFKRHGRLSLRVERLPQRAKMSAGRRNSDGSWSLASDELSDLNYLVPSNAPLEHELTIRVMTFEDGAATTLKVIQHAIHLEEIPDPAGNDEAVCRSNEAHDPVLRSQLGEMQSLFAVRESELADLRAAVEQAKSDNAAELQKARASWEQELHHRLAEVAAKVATEKLLERTTRQTEQTNKLVAQAEAQAEQKIAAERQKWQAETDLRLEKERQAWLAEHKEDESKRRASPATLKQAEERWRLQEAARSAAAHAEWQQQSAHALAEQTGKSTKLEALLATETDKCLKLEAALAHTVAQAASASGESAPELDRLRGELVAAKTALTEREQELVRSRAAQEEERVRLQTEAGQRLESDRHARQAEADQRLAGMRESLQAEAQQRLESERQRWQAEAAQRSESEHQALGSKAEQRLAAEREQWQAEAKRLLESERQRWQSETGQRIEKEHQAWQAQTDARLESERKQHQAESLAVLKLAEEGWKADEAARAAAASADWQQLYTRILGEEKDKSAKLEISLAVESDKCRKLEAALAKAQSQANTAAPASGEDASALQQLRDELASAKAALAERETELVRNRAEHEQAHARWQQEAQTALAAKAAAWKAEEATRLKAMAETRAHSEEALAQMTARCETAERALAEARSDAGNQAHNDDGYIESLRAEVAELRKALVKSETELGWARSALDQAQPLHIRRAAENLPIGLPQQQQQEEETEAPASAKHTFVRDFLMVMAVVLPVILAYPWFANYLPNGLRTNLATVTGGLLSTGNERPAATVPAAAPQPAPVVQHPTMTITRSLNVRATPSTKGAVVVTLPRGASLSVLEQNGNWTHVEVKDVAGKVQQGWVFSSNLGIKPAQDGVKSDVKDSAKDSTPAAPAAAATPKSAATPAVEPAEHKEATPPEAQAAPASPPSPPAAAAAAPSPEPSQ